MVALVFLKPGAGICFMSEQLGQCSSSRVFKVQRASELSWGLVRHSWVLVSEFTPQWPSPLSLRFWISNKTQRRYRGSHMVATLGGHHAGCLLLWDLYESASSVSPFCSPGSFQWFSSLYCEALQMILQQDGVWEALYVGLVSWTWLDLPLDLLSSITASGPNPGEEASRPSLSFTTLGHWSLVSLVTILNQPWKRWTFFLKALIHEVWCAASFKNFVILSEVREKKSDIV